MSSLTVCQRNVSLIQETVFSVQVSHALNLKKNVFVQRQ